MKFILFIITFIFINLPITGFGFDNTVILKTGGTGAFGSVKAHSKNNRSFWGGGINTQVSYHFTKWEFGLSSNLFWGKVNSITSKVNTTEVRGKAIVRTFAVNIFAKYHFDYLVKREWRPYVGLGPSWSQHTLKMKDFEILQGSFNHNNRIAYLTKGATLIVGLEENLEFKQMHPVYLEFTYTFVANRKVSLLDASNHKEIASLKDEMVNEDTYSHIYMINLGMTIF